MSAHAQPVKAQAGSNATPFLVHVIGTPAPSVDRLARALRENLPAAGASRFQADLTTEGSLLAAFESSAAVLFLVAHPGGAAQQAITAGASVENALSAWSVAARAILRSNQHCAQRVLFVDADEGVAALEQLAQALANWDAALDGVSFPEFEQAVDDPVAALIGHSAARDDVAAMRLYAELQARCIVFAAARSTSPDWRTAWRQYEDQARRRTADRESWINQSDSLRSEVERLQVELGHSKHEAGEHAARVETLRRDETLLALQLAQAQEELDTVYRRPARASSDIGLVDCDRLRILESADAAPHRHLHVDLRQVQSGQRHWHSIEVRLVEHHGRPGIVFLATGQSPEVICAWQASGREQLREFMLFVPGDDAGRQQLARLGASDWRMVVGIAGLLVRQLQHTQGDVAADWACVARRLQADLLGLEPRLRYDGCEATGGTAGNDSLLLEFKEAMYGSRPLGRIRLRWQPARGEIAWLTPDDRTALPLASWPGNDTSSLAAAFVIPVGPQGSAALRRAWWAAQPATNRALLLAVLEALPEAVRREPATAALVGPAHSLADAARTNLRQANWRAVARRMLGRSSVSVRHSAD